MCIRDRPNPNGHYVDGPVLNLDNKSFVGMHEVPIVYGLTIGEYANMILMSAMTSVLFLGGWLPLFDIAPFNYIPGPIWLILKISLCLFVFLWVRATTPRYRYDQLMRLGWKVFLPFSLLWLVLTAGFLVYTGSAPVLY